MRQETRDASMRDNMSETVRRIVSRRERAPRSPRMERALKRLIWRYSRALQNLENRESLDAQE